MLENTNGRFLPPAVVGTAANIGLLASLNYYRAAVNYFAPDQIVWVLVAIAGSCLLGWIAWAVAYKHLGEGKGTHPGWIGLAAIGLLGVPVYRYLLPDNHAKRKTFSKFKKKADARAARAAARHASLAKS